MTRTITAFFDSRTEAQAAADRLVAAGVSPSGLSIHDAGSAAATTDATTARTDAGDKGFWASLGDLFMPDEDRYAYSEGIRRGGSVLSVDAPDGEFDRVSDILEEAGSVDLDTREGEWRSQGWSGYDAATMGSASADYRDADDRVLAADHARTDYTDADRAALRTDDAAYGARTDTVAGDRAATDRAYAGGGTLGREEAIPVAEERLRVGKREVDHGRVRIRSYVVETPVEEHVHLRQESVHVERSPVDRAATAADNLFQERTIEAEERREEAVVSKEARVVEEVRLSKDVEERDEVVSDTVRRTEVEVEDERTGGRLAGDETLSAEERRRRGL